MLEKSETILLNSDGWTFRLKLPRSKSSAKTLLLIHGWSGDENSMWVFVNKFPAEFCILAPRGPFPSPKGGYAWAALSLDHPSALTEFESVAAKLIASTEALLKSLYLAPVPLHLMGFSQGAAMVYTLAIQYPEKIGKIAGLSGFLPEGAEARLKPEAFTAKPVFIAHGSRDQIVPVQWGQEAAQKLKLAGANVTYCEENTGHKLSRSCFNALRTFFAQDK
jgi:phospholipase/carboxylesterase